MQDQRNGDGARTAVVSDAQRSVRLWSVRTTFCSSPTVGRVYSAHERDGWAPVSDGNPLVFSPQDAHVQPWSRSEDAVEVSMFRHDVVGTRHCEDRIRICGRSKMPFSPQDHFHDCVGGSFVRYIRLSTRRQDNGESRLISVCVPWGRPRGGPPYTTSEDLLLFADSEALCAVPYDFAAGPFVFRTRRRQMYVSTCLLPLRTSSPSSSPLTPSTIGMHVSKAIVLLPHRMT